MKQGPGPLYKKLVWSPGYTVGLQCSVFKTCNAEFSSFYFYFSWLSAQYYSFILIFKVHIEQEIIARWACLIQQDVLVRKPDVNCDQGRPDLFSLVCWIKYSCIRQCRICIHVHVVGKTWLVPVRKMARLSLFTFLHQVKFSDMVHSPFKYIIIILSVRTIYC